MKSNIKKIVILGGTLLLGIWLGWLFFPTEDSEAHQHQVDQVEDSLWTCSMHPQIRLQEAGQCPICGMDLIPLQSAEASANPQAVELSPYAMKLSNIQTRAVGAGDIQNDLRLNGKVAVDERRVYTQSTHIPGRIEQLLVNFTGEVVRKGQPLARIYSPELATAQEELLQAYSMRNSQPELLAAAKEKLRNWRISEGRIDAILERGQVAEQFTIAADVGGVVMEKRVELGDYVERGMPLYEIADLSKVWVLFDLYEKDLSLVQVGDSIDFTVASLPGQSFSGRIAFVDPIIDRQTRVATARVEVANEEGKLKPEMFVSGSLSGGATSEERLTIPKSAVLWTGKRSVVYVKNDQNHSFTLREVVLGASLGDSYVVMEGLRPGEEIVINGTFTVDAAAQLAGKPSMMNSESSGASAPELTPDLKVFLQEEPLNFEKEVPEEFRGQLGNLQRAYLKVKDALVQDDLERARSSRRQFFTQLSEMQPENLSREAQQFWKEQKSQMTGFESGDQAPLSLEELRKEFVLISEGMIRLISGFGTDGKVLFVDYCPMANSDRGAYWLSEESQIRNPYMGQSMLTCGEMIQQIN